MNKYLDFFTKQYVEVKKLEDFKNSYPYEFYTQMFGNLVYSEEPCPNFINIHKRDDKLIISDGIYADLFPENNKIASLVPENIFKKLDKNQTGGTSFVGNFLVDRSRR